jgi:hypothetical protein
LVAEEREHLLLLVLLELTLRSTQLHQRVAAMELLQVQLHLVDLAEAVVEMEQLAELEHLVKVTRVGATKLVAEAQAELDLQVRLTEQTKAELE